MTKTFAQPSLRANPAGALPIHFIATRDSSGEPCYFLLRAPNTHYRALVQAPKGEPLDIAEYGEILVSGFGSPSLLARQHIKQEWGVTIPEDF